VRRQWQCADLHGRYWERALDGTPLAALLDDCAPLKRAIEIVFFRRGIEKV